MGFFDDLGNAVSSVVSTVGNAVEDTVDAVANTVGDGVDTVVDTVQGVVESGTNWVCQNTSGTFGDIACGVSKVVGGGLDGYLQGLEDQFDDVIDLAKDVAGLVGDVLRLDGGALIDDLGNTVLDLLDLGIDVIRFRTGGYLVGGVVDAFSRNALQDFVADLLQDRFGSDPDRLAAIRSMVGLRTTDFGFPITAEHRVMRLDSTIVPLWDWHERGVIDLYAMAGLLSFDSFEVFPRPRTVVRTVDPLGNDDSFWVDRTVIAKYLASKGSSVRLRVYAMSREAVAEKLHTATEKCREIGIRLSWNDSERFSWFSENTVLDIETEDEYRIALDESGEYFVTKKLRSGKAGQDCTLLAIGGFRFKELDGKELFGWTFGRHIEEGDQAAGCRTPERTDPCCNTVVARGGPAVIHRDLWPSDLFLYVLAHEIGHYFGLCHSPHTGFQNIMWRTDQGWLDWGLISYYWDSEPHFTLEDGKNVWRFLVSELEVCFPPPTPPIG